PRYIRENARSTASRQKAAPQPEVPPPHRSRGVAAADISPVLPRSSLYFRYFLFIQANEKPPEGGFSKAFRIFIVEREPSSSDGLQASARIRPWRFRQCLP